MAILQIHGYFLLKKRENIYIISYFCSKQVLTGTHNLCFREKIRKIGIPMQTPVLHIKVGYKGVYITRTCFLDEINK